MAELTDIINQYIELARDNKVPAVTNIIDRISDDNLIKSMLIEAGTLAADVFELRLSGREKSIGLWKIKEFKSVMNKKAQGKKKIGIIYHAEKMTAEAQNSLLKMFEDLSSNTAVILITETDSLLPTVKSRVGWQVRVIDQSLSKNPLVQEYLRMSLAEKIAWQEKAVQSIDLKIFLQDMLCLKHISYELKEKIQYLIGLVEANVNKKLILDFLAVEIEQQKHLPKVDNLD